ncbi:MAG TPA: hypothetical protein VLS90_14310 [Thermodesulfobacteriota bacterium]|nr:hypothetical protein [Thermodesulfobacteriota bacterium]
MEDATRERFFYVLLKTTAEQHYGDERTGKMDSSLTALARALSAIESFPVSLEEEPAFFGFTADV